MEWNRRGIRVAALVVALVAAVIVRGDAGAFGRAAAGPREVANAASVRVPHDAAVHGPVLGGAGEDDAGFAALATRLRIPADVPPPADLPAPSVDAAPAAAALAAAIAPAADVAITPPPRSAFASTSSASPPSMHAPPTRYGDVAPSGGTWALLVGINDYPGVQYDLHSAVTDVQDVDEALRRDGVTADRRMILRDGDATSGKIRGGLDWLSAHAGGDATIVLFYAGHVQKLSEGTEAFVGSDGDTVTDAEVAEYLDRSPAPRAWIGIAACYAAGFDEVVRPGRILTAAAGADSLAYESSAFGRSYLVEYLVHRAMLTDGITTVKGAFDRAARQLRQEHPDRVPVLVDDLGGDLDLRSGGASSPAPPPPSDGGTSGSPPPSSPPPPSSDGCAGLTVGVVRCSH